MVPLDQPKRVCAELWTSKVNEVKACHDNGRRVGDGLVDGEVLVKGNVTPQQLQAKKAVAQTMLPNTLG